VPVRYSTDPIGHIADRLEAIEIRLSRIEGGLRLAGYCLVIASMIGAAILGKVI